MRAGVANPADPVDRAHRPQELGEQRAAAGEVAPVGVHVLAQEGDLDRARRSQPLHLGHDLVERPADLLAPHRRDDAEGARVVAADLDGDPGGVGQPPPHGQRGGELALVATATQAWGGLVEDLHHRPSAVGRLAQELDGPAHVVGAEDGVHLGRPLLDEVAVLLGQAPAHRDLHARVPVLDRLKVAEVPVQLVVGVLPDAAGVEEDDVGLLDVVGGLHPLGLEHARQPLGVVDVHLAAERPDQVLAGHPPRLEPRGTEPVERAFPTRLHARRRVRLCVVSLLVALTAAACSSDGGPTAAGPSSTPARRRRRASPSPRRPGRPPPWPRRPGSRPT